MGDIKRVFVLPGVSLLAGALVSGCYLGPDPVQYGALAVVGGKAGAVVALCGRSEFDLSVFEDDNNHSADNEFVYWAATVTTAAPADDVVVELLGADRAGLRVTSRDETGSPGVTGMRARALTSFEPGLHYTLNASEGGPEGTAAPMVTFTADDLARIGEGQVLAPIDYKKADVISRESFVKSACAKKGPGAR
ncbi:hypothetical protein GCM10010435_90630 [Winogradskya consettensis]|uniref:Uncharacterized protein n=1 Tax=Winogradskya consettensis TaxID=113560 RepID=A0A919SZC9_9ACTN|nr:hypothetical protein [Actinoplanes consettensis]GIM79973.1 hypothetical protein Aco04nite_68260 [Actinoplanes consettensis]